MSTTRIFNSSKFFQPTDGEPVRSVVTESKDAVVVAWYIKPGQKILAHTHPNGQDTWTVLTGRGEYYLDKAGTTKPIIAGDVVVAHTGCVHGVFNNGDEPLVFISVVSPADAGYPRACFQTITTTKCRRSRSWLYNLQQASHSG
jgi:quercetin dioxygenase-like cupin family protein